MPFGLLKYGFSRRYPARGILPKTPELKPRHDVVVLGAGAHGLAAASSLAKNYGITNRAAPDTGYPSGGTPASTTPLRPAHYPTPQGIAFSQAPRGPSAGQQ